MNPFYNYNQWPFYKPYQYDVTSGLPMPPTQQFPFPFMVAPRQWYPGPQPWLGQIRNTDQNTMPSYQAPMVTLSAVENNRGQVAMETTDDDQDDNDDSTGTVDFFVIKHRIFCPPLRFWKILFRLLLPNVWCFIGLLL